MDLLFCKYPKAAITIKTSYREKWSDLWIFKRETNLHTSRDKTEIKSLDASEFKSSKSGVYFFIILKEMFDFLVSLSTAGINVCTCVCYFN